MVASHFDEGKYVYYDPDRVALVRKEPQPDGGEDHANSRELDELFASDLYGTPPPVRGAL